MRKLIAIGGGEIPRTDKSITESETYEIDKRIIELTETKKPKLLFIPTASGDAQGYVENVKAYFEGTFNCDVTALKLIEDCPSVIDIKDKVYNADVIYVGGGNTLRMLKLWRKVSLDKILFEAWKKGVVMSGLSAGAICWFKYGCSDSRKFTNPDADLIRVTGLGWIDALYCPHYNIDKDRPQGVKKLMKKTHRIPALAFDNGTAIEIVDNQYKILTSIDNAQARKCYWKKGEYYIDKISSVSEYKRLSNLLVK